VTTRTTRSQLAGLAACFVLAIAAIAIFSLTGCGTFFLAGQNNSTTSTGSTGSTSSTGTTGSTGSLYAGDFVYVSDPTTNVNQINAYTVASGALTPISGSPISLGIPAVSMAVTPNDSLLYVSDGSAIYAYTISTSGSLSLLQGGPVFSNETVTSIAISPSGNYLFALSPTNNQILEFSITYGSGVLTAAGAAAVSLPLYNGSIPETPSQVRMCPSGECIVAALGNVGIAIAALNQTNGVLGNFVPESPTNSTAAAAYDVAIDANNYIYVPQTNGLYVYSYNNGTGTITNVTPTSGPYTLGTGPITAVVSNNSQYVYVANRGNPSASPAIAATISGFSIGASGALTSIGAATPASTFTSALSMDATGNYLVALGYDTSVGVQLFSISSNGTLASKATAASGNNTSAAAATIASVH
jgi:6-phosphogluconolactonase (cycloisomerase 2 family)